MVAFLNSFGDFLGDSRRFSEEDRFTTGGVGLFRGSSRETGDWASLTFSVDLFVWP